MLKIKLLPTGKKHSRKFRVVVVEDREKLTHTPRTVLGYYDPTSKQISVDKQETKKWMANGAQATPTVRKLLGL